MSSPDKVADDFLQIIRAERRDLLDRLRATRFSTLRTGFPQSQIIPYATYSPWLTDDAFLAVYDRVKGHTLVDVYRCYELYALAREVGTVPGDLVEVGVWRGGTAAVLASGAPARPIHLFDTFAGVVKAQQNVDTLYSGGEHADAKAAEVKTLFSNLGLLCTIHEGVFPDQTGDRLPPRIALAHIDVDTYASARDALSSIWPALSPGGIVVVDDYGFFGCEGVTQAVNEARSVLTDALFVYNVNGHGLAIKR